MAAINEALVQSLARITRFPGEYISHCSALFFYGLSGTLPEVVTVVSSRRRRRQSLGDRQVTFVSHGNSQPENIVTRKVKGHELRLSSIEATLVDLVSDNSHAPVLENLAAVFSGAGFSCDELIRVAQRVSDSALKRCLFWCAWAGRIAYDQIPFDALASNSVVLDSRYTGEPLLTESRLRVKYPAALLRLSPYVPGCQRSSAEMLKWLELRAYAGFREYCHERRWLPIYLDGRPRNQILLSGFHQQELAAFKSERSALLASIMEGRPEKDLGREIPVCCLDWAREVKNVRLLFADLEDWVAGSLDANDPRDLETALFWAFRLKLRRHIVKALSKCADLLMVSNRYRVLHELCESFLKSAQIMPVMYPVYARVCLRYDNIAGAVELLARGRELCCSRKCSKVVLAEFAYAAAAILVKQRKFVEAEHECMLGEDLACKDGNQMMAARFMQMRGTIYCRQSMLKEGQAHYMRALDVFIERQEFLRQENIYFNLGKFQLHFCCYKQGSSNLGKSISLIRRFNLKGRLMPALYIQGIAMINSGQIESAQLAFAELYKMLKSEDGSSGIYMPMVVTRLAWICELLGQPVIARHYWLKIADYADSKYPLALRCSRKNILTSKALTECNFDLAAKLNADIFMYEREYGVSRTTTGFALYTKGFIEALKDDENARTSLTEARKILENCPENEPLWFLEIFFFCLFGGSFPEKSLNKILESGCYDPLWFFYADRLAAVNSEEANTFLAQHFVKSSPAFIEQVCRRFEPFRDYVNKKYGKVYSEVNIVYVTESGLTYINKSEYRSLKNALSQSVLSIDMVEGRINWCNSQIKLATSTYPSLILNQLLIAYPEPASIEDLHYAVCGRQYEAELDEQAFKAALYRLCKDLRELNTCIKLERHKKNGVSVVSLKIVGYWQAFVAEAGFTCLFKQKKTCEQQAGC